MEENDSDIHVSMSGLDNRSKEKEKKYRRSHKRERGVFFSRKSVIGLTAKTANSTDRIILATDATRTKPDLFISSSRNDSYFQLLLSNGI